MGVTIPRYTVADLEQFPNDGHDTIRWPVPGLDLAVTVDLAESLAGVD